MIATRIKQTSMVFASATFIALGSISAAQAEIILESATFSSATPSSGYAVSEIQQLGWRFTLDTPLQVSEIGGYFGNFSNSGNIFGAIVSLDSPFALPSGTAESLENVQAATVFTPNSDSLSDTLTPLSVLLEPGSYGLIFGSGKFGATGESAMPFAGVNNPSSSYFFANSFYGDYTWLEGDLSGLRFIVKGEEVKSVPETTPVFGLLAFGGLSLFGILKQRLVREPSPVPRQ